MTNVEDAHYEHGSHDPLEWLCQKQVRKRNFDSLDSVEYSEGTSTSSWSLVRYTSSGTISHIALLCCPIHPTLSDPTEQPRICPYNAHHFRTRSALYWGSYRYTNRFNLTCTDHNLILSDVSCILYFLDFSSNPIFTDANPMRSAMSCVSNLFYFRSGLLSTDCV